jgi:hypothetical protein
MAMVAPFSTGSVGKINWQIYADGFDVTPVSGSSMAGERIPVKFTAKGGAAFSGVWPVYIYSKAGATGQFIMAALNVE